MHTNILISFVVPVDGEAAAGKGTAITRIAEHFRQLGWPVLSFSSGDIYRGMSILAMRFLVKTPEEIASTESTQLASLALSNGLDLQNGRMMLSGCEIPEDLLHSEEVSAYVPYIAKMPGVRSWANELMWEVVEDFIGIILIDGRDIGTEVFPNAPVKFYLTVSEEEAAKRHGHPLESIQNRNEMDRTRDIAQMKAAPDAIVIDTTNLTIPEVSTPMIEKITAVLPALTPA
jgi:CMP/dCMP kinase